MTNTDRSRNKIKRRVSPCQLQADPPEMTKTATLPDGLVQKTISSAPDQRQNNESRNQPVEILCKIFGSSLTGITLAEMNVLQESSQSGVNVLLQRYVEDFENRMDIADPLEGLLIEQALLTHHRVLTLSRQAAAAKTPNAIATLNQQCDQASNTFRRIVLAIAEYRRPPQTVFAQNINAAHQQIVNERVGRRKKKSNERTRIS